MKIKTFLLACVAVVTAVVAAPTALAALTESQRNRITRAVIDRDVGDALADAADFNEDVTAGTAEGSKALVLSSAKTITGITQITTGHHKLTPYPSVISASADLSTATLHAYNFFRVNTGAGAVDLDFADDADMDAADRGSRYIFQVEGAGGALTITAGSVGVTVVKTGVDADGTSCEDEGDRIEVLVVSTATIVTNTFCAD